MSLEAHLNSLLSEHGQTLREQVVEAYREGAMMEARRLANITPIERGDIDLDIERDLGTLMSSAGARLTWFDTRFFEMVEEDGKQEATDRLFDGGVELTRRDRPYKRVESNGTASMADATVRWNRQIRPKAYFEWLSNEAIYEAEQRGKVAVQREIEDVIGHVWVSELDEETTPSDARLHGVIFESPVVYPPIGLTGQAELHPYFDEDSRLARQNVNTDRMEKERNEWFVKLHEAEGVNWLDRPVDVDDYTPEFLYSEYLPLRPERFIPDNA